MKQQAVVFKFDVMVCKRCYTTAASQAKYHNSVQSCQELSYNEQLVITLYFLVTENE